MNNNTLSKSTLYLMSAAAGLVVANLYYNQPLLYEISVDLKVTEAAVSNVALATQLGYAFGLLLIIPLGDKVNNKKILKYDFILMGLALLAMALSNSLLLLIVSSFFLGATSAIPQLFVPMAAQLSAPQQRGKAIGIVMSGLLIGILGSRVISGVLAHSFGWRFIYYIALLIMALLYVLLQRKLPAISPNYKGTYFNILQSVFSYFRKEPGLRIAALYGRFAFAG
jgi:predicted MFS family arabinose efflux permease